MLKIVVPMEPPSANHYMKYRVMQSGGKSIVSAYPSAVAKAWWHAVRIYADGQTVEAEQYEVAYVVYQGKGSRGDVDNASKCCLDGIARAGVISNDHYVTAVHGYKFRDRENPRTEIFVAEYGHLRSEMMRIPPVQRSAKRKRG